MIGTMTCVEGRGFKRLFDVISWSSVKALFFVLLFIYLSQCGFHESRRTAQQRDEPHPEHCAGAAGYDSTCNSHDVSRTYSGSRGNHESLERGYGIPVLFRLSYDSDGLPEEPELNEFRPE